MTHLIELQSLTVSTKFLFLRLVENIQLCIASASFRRPRFLSPSFFPPPPPISSQFQVREETLSPPSPLSSHSHSFPDACFTRWSTVTSLYPLTFFHLYISAADCVPLSFIFLKHGEGSPPLSSFNGCPPKIFLTSVPLFCHSSTFIAVVLI